MAVLLLSDHARFAARGARKYGSGSDYGSSIDVGAISGGTIVAIMAVLFVCGYIYFSRKAKKQFKQTGKPISHGKIFLKALGVALVVGILAECLCGGSTDSDNAPAQPGNDASTADYSQPAMAVPPMTQPGMDWTRQHSAAADPVQG